MLLLPEWLSREAWDGFCDLRDVMWKSKKIPWTKRAQELILNDLADCNRKGFDVNYMLDEAVIHGWRKPFANERTPRMAVAGPSGITEERRQEILQMIDRQKGMKRPA